MVVITSATQMMSSAMVEDGPGRVARAQVTSDQISAPEHEQLVMGPDRGAVVSFAGVVRNHDHGRSITSLDYLGHPGAQEVLAAVALEAARRSGVSAVAVSHRLGKLEVGDTALACAVAAPHRMEAFETCGWLVDEVKKRLPVWKRQEFVDGTHEWVNCA